MVNSAGGAARQVAAKLLVDGKDVETPLAWPSIPGPAGCWSLEARIPVWVSSSPWISTAGGWCRLAWKAQPPAAAQRLPDLRKRQRCADGGAVRQRQRRIEGTPTAILPDVAFGRGNMPAWRRRNGTLAFPGVPALQPP